MSQRNNRVPASPGAAAEKAAKRALADAQHEHAFRDMLILFLKNGPQTETVPALAVLCAFCEGVVLVQEAGAFSAALHGATWAGDGAYVYYQGHHGRQRCVKLNPVTRAVSMLTEGFKLAADDAIRSFLDWLSANGPTLFKALSDDRKSQLAAVERGAACFWSKYLPRILSSDADGALSLRPLRPQALARRATGLPLVRGAPIGPSVFAACASQFPEAGSIDGSDVMQQVVVIMTTGDGTKLGALRAQQLRLLEPLLDEVEDDLVGLLMLTVASGICERGTVQTDEPSHSASARYVRELRQMFAAAPKLAASLPTLPPSERRAAYAELLTHAGDQSDGRAALTNADMHLCDAVGSEPTGPLAGCQDESPRRGTRYLTDGEGNAVVEGSPPLAPTPELMIVVRALGHIFKAKPSRPGDMRDARYEDLEIGKNRVVLNLRRRAGLKGQKTAAAEGPTDFKEPAVIEALVALKELRKGQAAVDGCPLWGRDLKESRRLYTRACAIIDSACKHVTGDPFESVYSFRHGAVSEEVFDALMIDNPEHAQAALKRASVRANHRSIDTTVENYFHLAAEVMQKHVARAVGNLLTSPIAARWSGVGVHALDRRAARSKLTKVDVLWAAIADAAPQSAFRDITLDFVCAPPVSAQAQARLSLDDVARSYVCSALRFKDGNATWDSEEARTAGTSAWTRSLVAARTRYARHMEQAVRPATLQQHKLRPIARRLRCYGDSALARTATQLWRACAKRGMLDVTDPTHLTAWLTFLTKCGVPASRLVLRLEPSMRSKIEVVNAAFSIVTRLVPSIDGVPGGKGRPAAYLLISSKDPIPRETLPPAATSMAGFHALMLSACMREDLLGLSKGEARDAQT